MSQASSSTVFTLVVFTEEAEFFALLLSPKSINKSSPVFGLVFDLEAVDVEAIGEALDSLGVSDQFQSLDSSLYP